MVYKCISKLLSSRLKEVLPELISESQGAFINSRELLFNVLVWQEVAIGYERKNIAPRCMMKIDIKKAYDSIHWDFIQELLVNLKFPQEFIKWVMACITTTSFSINLNSSSARREERLKTRRSIITSSLCAKHGIFIKISTPKEQDIWIWIPSKL